MRLLLFLLAPQILGPILMDRPSAVNYYCRTITIRTGQVSGTLTNFPMLVSGTYSYLAHTDYGGKVKNASGYDVRFYSSSDCSGAKLDWETETYTATTGAVNYWVKVASVADGTVISMRYGEAGITTDQSNPTAVWDSNYKGVWHLRDGSTLSLLDSTSNDNDGTSVMGNTDYPAAATGKIGGAVRYRDYNRATFTNSASMQITGDLTLSAWIKTTDTAVYEIFGKYSSSHGYGVLMPSGNYIDLLIGGSTVGTYEVSQNIHDTSWHYVVATYTAATPVCAIYVDGSAVSGSQYGTLPTSITDNGEVFRAGYAAIGGTPFDGLIDEQRVSGSVRAAAWVSAEYNNQNSPATFYTVGSEVAH